MFSSSNSICHFPQQSCLWLFEFTFLTDTLVWKIGPILQLGQARKKLLKKAVNMNLTSILTRKAYYANGGLHQRKASSAPKPVNQKPSKKFVIQTNRKLA